MMIIVTGEARFADGEIARIRGALERNVAATRAEAGCARYSYAVDISDPNLLHIAEEWSDEEAVAAHMAAPHMAELMGALSSAKLETISVKAYEGNFLKVLLGGA
jgi:quinol monooxygenase YgiN